MCETKISNILVRKPLCIIISEKENLVVPDSGIFGWNNKHFIVKLLMKKTLVTTIQHNMHKDFSSKQVPLADKLKSNKICKHGNLVNSETLRFQVEYHNK